MKRLCILFIAVLMITRLSTSAYAATKTWTPAGLAKDSGLETDGGNTEFATTGSPAWWNENYTYRQQLKITNNNAGQMVSGYSVKYQFNHSNLVANNSIQPDGDDLLVKYTSNSGTSWTDRERAIDNDTSSTDDDPGVKGWNNTTTTIWFNTNASINAGNNDTNHYLYYGNSAATAPTSDLDDIFLLDDDFSASPLASRWTLDTNTQATFSSGNVRLEPSDSWGGSGMQATSDTFSAGIIMETRAAGVAGELFRTILQNNGNSDRISFQNDKYAAKNDGSLTASSTMGLDYNGTWYVFGVGWVSSTEGEWYVDGTAKTPHTTNIPDNDSVLFPYLTGRGFVKVWSAIDLDWVRIRYFATDSNGDENYSVTASGSEETRYFDTSSATLTATSTNGQAFDSVSGFSATTAGDGTIKLQISPDNGTTWYYWSGSAWTATTDTADTAEANTAAEVNSNISKSPFNLAGTFKFRALFDSNGGVDQAQLGNVTLTYTKASQFAISVPSGTQTSNKDFNITITAQDSSENTITAYSNTVNLTHSGSGSLSVTQVAASSFVNGIATVTLNYSGKDSITITATDADDGTITGTSSSISFGSGSYTVSASSTQTAGSSFTLTVTAKDTSGSTWTDYSGTANLSISSYVSPAVATTLSTTAITSKTITSWSSGVGTASISYPDCGTITIKATDSNLSTRTGTSSNITFFPSSFTVTPAATTQTVGKGFNLTVTAKNSSGTTTPNYSGTVNLTEDGAGTLSTSSIAASSFSSGTATVSTSYDRYGTAVKLTATDSAHSASTGTSSAIAFIPKDFTVTIPSPPSSRTRFYTDEAFSPTVQANDESGNAISNYTGTVTFSSSNSNVALPSNYTFTTTDAGSHSFTDGAYSTIAQDYSISVADTSYTSITGTSDIISAMDGTIKVLDKSGSVGTLTMTVQLLDENGEVITDDDSTTFLVTLTESNDNSSASSDTTSSKATVSAGVATISVTDPDAEKVTVTPESTPTLTATAGTATFGAVSSEGVQELYWYEVE